MNTDQNAQSDVIYHLNKIGTFFTTQERKQTQLQSQFILQNETTQKQIQELQLKLSKNNNNNNNDDQGGLKGHSPSTSDIIIKAALPKEMMENNICEKYINEIMNDYIKINKSWFGIDKEVLFYHDDQWHTGVIAERGVLAGHFLIKQINSVKYSNLASLSAASIPFYRISKPMHSDSDLLEIQKLTDYKKELISLICPTLLKRWNENNNRQEIDQLLVLEIQKLKDLEKTVHEEGEKYQELLDSKNKIQKDLDLSGKMLLEIKNDIGKTPQAGVERGKAPSIAPQAVVERGKAPSVTQSKPSAFNLHPINKQKKTVNSSDSDSNLDLELNNNSKTIINNNKRIKSDDDDSDDDSIINKKKTKLKHLSDMKSRSPSIETMKLTRKEPINNIITKPVKSIIPPQKPIISIEKKSDKKNDNLKMQCDYCNTPINSSDIVRKVLIERTAIGFSKKKGDVVIACLMNKCKDNNSCSLPACNGLMLFNDDSAVEECLICSKIGSLLPTS